MTEHFQSGRFQGGRDEPWPYDDLVDPAEEGAPTWICPGGTCECHAREVVDGRPHRITLYDEQANAMPGARCRAWLGGVLLNAGQRHADGAGGVNLLVPEKAGSLLVEWAPKEMPLDDRFPFRLHYFLDMARDGVARRLHNAGFFLRAALADNVKHFQATYGPSGAPLTGRPEDIAAQLGAYHDVTGLPPIHEHGSAERAAPPASVPTVLPPFPPQGCAREPRVGTPFEVGITVGQHEPWTDNDKLVIVARTGEVHQETRLGDARADGSLRRVQFRDYTKNDRYTVKVRFGEYAYILYEDVNIYSLVSPATPYATARRPAQVFVDEPA